MVFFAQEYLDRYLKSGVVQKVINTPIITYIIRQIDYTKSTYTEVQKLLLEVYLSMITLRDMAEQQIGHKLDTSIELTLGISNAKMALRIVKEQKDFKFLRYYIHQQSLPAEVAKEFKQSFGTVHPHYDTKIRAKYSIAEVERI